MMRRVLLLLGVFTISSIPPRPPPVLPTEAPHVYVGNLDCAPAQRDAQTIAQVLGFSRIRGTCGQVTLSGAATPRMPIVRNLVAYSFPLPRPVLPIGPSAAFQIPADIPWVSTEATIVASIHIDALLLRMESDNLLQTAFALENAGVSRDDMMTEPYGAGQRLFVRVRAPSIARELKLARIARERAFRSDGFLYSEIVFVRDCNGAMASLSGLALNVARNRANIMARAAGTTLGAPLAVIDPGGMVLDAICGLGPDANVDQLVAAYHKASSSDLQGAQGRLEAAIVRSVTVAWRLKLPPNPAGQPWNQNDELKQWYARQPPLAFLADGNRAYGDALADTIAPNQAFVQIPQWAYEPLQHSPFADRLTHFSEELNPLMPTVVLHASNAAQLQQQVRELHDYISRLRRTDVWVLYTRADCRALADTALFYATRTAIMKLQGKPLRYLQQRGVFTTGVSCMNEPLKLYEDSFSMSDAAKYGTMIGSVAVGY